MGKLLATMFLLVPALELVGLIVLGSYLGFWATVLYVIVAMMLGSWLIKQAGFKVMRTFTVGLARGQAPSKGVISGLVLLVAGILFAIPGPFSDVLGVLILLPPTRVLITAPLERYARSRLQRAGSLGVDLGGSGDGADGHGDDADDSAPPPPSRGRIIDI